MQQYPAPFGLHDDRLRQHYVRKFGKALGEKIFEQNEAEIAEIAADFDNIAGTEDPEGLPDQPSLAQIARHNAALRRLASTSALLRKAEQVAAQRIRRRHPAAAARAKGKASKGNSGNASKKSGDSGSDDPDPEPHVVYYNYKSFARLFNLAEQTLRNRVANGTFPPPLKTAFGPRFAQSHIDFALNPCANNPTKNNKVGRPRIAQQSKVGAA